MATLTLRSQKGSPLTNQEVDDNFSNLNSSKLEVSGGTLTGPLSVTILTSSNVNGDEGGKLLLAKPATNTTIDTSVTVKLYQNKLQIFETGGLYRGAHLDITTSAADIGSKILTSSNINSYAPTLTGVGASGTWGINITGNSATVTSITSSQVTSALGYTPYNSSNPSGYITGYTETDTLATVTARGASTSTVVQLNGGGGDGLPALRINQTSAAGSANWLGSFINSGLNAAAGKWGLLLLGQAESSKNSGYLGFQWQGNSSNSNAVTLGLYAADNLLRVYGGGYTEMSGSSRAPIFYDLDDTGYYLNPAASGSVALRVQGEVRFHANDGTTTHFNYSNGGYENYLRGTTYFDSGNVYFSSGRLRWTGAAYDWDDTSYYVDPNSLSNIYRLNVVGYNDSSPSATYGIQMGGGGAGIEVWNFNPGGSGAYRNLTFYGTGWNGSAVVTRDILTIGNYGGYVGIRNTSPNYELDITGTGYASNDFRAPIFYDSNDTGYYTDPTSTSNMHTVTATNFRMGNALYLGGNNYYINNNSTWFGTNTSFRSDSDIRATIFYDQNDTGYYVDPAGGNARISRDLYISGSTGGNYGNRLIVGNTDTVYTLQDGNVRPTIQAHGQYPVVSLNHTVTSNGSHGPTVQFTANGTGSQFVIGMNGSGTRLDIGVSSYGDWNPHNGIADYNGTTGWRMDNSGNVYNYVSNRSPIFYDSNDTGYYVNPNSTDYSARFAGNIYFTNYAKIGIEDVGMDCYLYITDNNPTVDGISYGGEFYFYGDKSISSSYLNFGGAIVENILRANNSLRAPIFYDSNDTGYYLNPNGTSNLNSLLVGGRYVKVKSGDIGTGIGTTGWFTIANYGSGRCEDTLVISDADSGRHNFVKVNIVWSYGSGGVTVVQSGRHGASTIRHIRLMYNTSDQTYGGVLVQVYCENPSWTLYVHSEGQGSPGWGTLSIYGTAVQQDSPSGWAQYSRIDGINDQARLATTGYITSQNEVYAYGSLRSPIFYDNDDTGYYVNPNSNSNFAGDVNASQFYVGGWFRNNGSNTGLYNQSTTQHLSSSTNGYWDMSSTTSVSGIRFYTGGHVSSLRGYVYADTGNNIGFLNSGGSWRARVVGDDYWLVDGSSARAQLYYDSNDTGYYWDGASTSKWNESNQNGWHTFNNYGLGITGTYDSYRLQTVFAMGSAYRMSSDGTSASNMYGIAWSHPNAGSVGGANNLNDHGILIINNGSFRAALSSRAVFSADVRGTQFYDYNDTGYYVDPNSTTVLYRPSAATQQRWSATWRAMDDGNNRPNITSDTNYWTTTMGWGTNYGTWNSYWKYGFGGFDCWGGDTGHPQGSGYVHAQGIQAGIHYATGDGSSAYGWQMVGAADADSRWWLRGKWGGTTRAWYEIVLFGRNVGGDLYANIMYDSNNTGYYCDPASTTNLNVVAVQRAYAGYDAGVTNSFSCSDWFRSSGNTGWYNASYGGGIYMEDTTWVRVYNNKAFYVNNQIAATGNVTAYYSDERLKTKVGIIDNALAKVCSLEGFLYINNDLAKANGYNSDKIQVALSAQQVQRVQPEVVSLAPFDMHTDELTGEITSKSGENYLTIDYAKLVPLLIEAVKEQQQQIEQQQQQINNLTELVKNLANKPIV